MENNVFAIITDILEDEKMLKKYRQRGKNINQVSYVYGFMTLFSVVVMTCLQVFYIK